MTLAVRLVAVSVAASLVLTGPWLPGTFAQQPSQSAPPASPAPASQPVPPGSPAPADQPVPPPPPPPPYPPGAMEPGQSDPSRMPYGVYATAAGVSTAFLIPGRTVTCILGTGLFLGTLALTLGSGYRFATGILEEGCGGKWIVRAEDFTPDRPAAPGPNPAR
jgi:uncharacterized membrane protein